MPNPSPSKTAPKLNLNDTDANSTRDLTKWLRAHGVSIAKDDRKPELVAKVEAFIDALCPVPVPEVKAEPKKIANIAPTPKPKKAIKRALIPIGRGQGYPIDAHNYSKECPCCGAIKALTEFGMRKMAAGPRAQTWCKECRANKNLMSRNDRTKAKEMEVARRTLADGCSLKNPPDYIANEADYLGLNRLRMDGREIDFQKQRLYNAQGKQRKECGTLATVEEATTAMKAIVNSGWFKSRFGKREITIRFFTPPSGFSDCKTEEDGSSVIRLASNAKAGKALYWTLIHEIVHAAIHSPATDLKHSPHGALYCAVLLDFIKKFIGEEAAATLEGEYQKYKVEYLTAAQKKERAKAQVNPEAT